MPRQPTNPSDRGVTRYAQLQMCPHCGYPFDAMGTHDGSEGTPSPGAVLVCLNCSAVGVVADDGRTWRKLTVDEQASFDRGDEDWEDARIAVERNKRLVDLGMRTKYAQRGPGRPN